MSLLIGFFIAGMILVIAEFFLPGMIAGIIGVLCLIVATGMAFQQFGVMMGLYIAASELFIGILAFVFWVKYFPNSSLGKIFSLKKAPKQSSSSENFEKLVGEVGKSVTMLRPSGAANFNGHRYDVVSEGSHIPEGKDIKVVKVEGIRIVVRAL